MDTFLTCQTSQGFELRATIARLTRFAVVFEAPAPQVFLRSSEVLKELTIHIHERPVYTGKAVISKIVDAGTTAVCEATLEDGWLDVGQLDLNGLQASLGEFLDKTKSAFKILPEFKLAVADLQIVLGDLRLWFDQLELSLQPHSTAQRQEMEERFLTELSPRVAAYLGGAFERFNEACGEVDEEWQAAHRVYVKRQLHPWVLCAPFMYRTYKKPLGYAGDYEMVNMMVRPPFEGPTLYAKMLNAFFLNTPPVVAHRNRIDLLTQLLVQETSRVARAGRPARILNLGCGPAWEIQQFLANSSLSNQAHFTLLDFNQETIEYTQRVLHRAREQHCRNTQISLIKKSVAQFVGENRRSAAGACDLVYCAGLFDYLPDHVCRQVMRVFYEMTLPGGLVVVTNVDTYNPSRPWMDYAVDWNLLHRDSRALASLSPPQADPETVRVVAESLGVNIFLECRKPAHG